MDRLVRLAGGIFLAACLLRGAPPALLMISVDGLRPDYVLQADQYGLRIPALRRLVETGAYASVTGVVPTVTYPSHTTLLTGVSPAKHGILANTPFDPLGQNHGGWYWYAEDIQAPTLWEEARRVKLVTASVHWPVSVGARIDYNLPQVWRAGTADDRKLVRALSTPGLLDELERGGPKYVHGFDESLAGDQTRGEFAVRLLERKRPNFMTVYFTALDHAQHETGPFSPESLATLEAIDVLIGRLRATAANVSGSDVVVCVVSDHGFVKTDHEVNLLSAFAASDLVELDEQAHVKAWQANVWASGGSAAIMIKPGAETSVKEKTGKLLRFLESDPASGIRRVLDGAAMERQGGFPGAAFVVDLRPGYKFGQRTKGPLVAALKAGGMHGYLPDLADMNATFLIEGAKIPAGRSLGQIDMRDIAPTLAAILGVRLPAAEGRNLFEGGK